MERFAPIFERLRETMLVDAAGLPIVRDGPGDLTLNGRSIDPKTGALQMFGAVTTKRSYVAYHLFPLYTDPTQSEHISTALSKRRQGKSCFNFKVLDEELFAELGALTSRLAQL